MSFIKAAKLMNFLEYAIYTALLIGSIAYLWDVFTLFEARQTSMKVKEVPITEQPTIIITTNEDNGYFGRHIDELQEIKLIYSSYSGWGDNPYIYKRNSDSMANHKVIKYATRHSGFA